MQQTDKSDLKDEKFHIWEAGLSLGTVFVAPKLNSQACGAETEATGLLFLVLRVCEVTKGQGVILHLMSFAENTVERFERHTNQ